jgi:hypothetical protein
MLEELLMEIRELQEYKNKYEFAQNDKKVLSAFLFRYMEKEYEKMLYFEKVKAYQENACVSCRHRDDCTKELPDDIFKPIPSDKDWIPERVGCKDFEWN